ncbi:alpha-2-macroglobulin-P-like [Siniperca chuatsi]|uniref:alpha-2-macroglobulin-P-like n=1 Tax=Siniperca chuatsi TaxID=119488 RepID=UPI001CE12DE4|nr:alpha-2-macroglobulin-P-like [Siniperca chuatsi]
MQVTALPDSLCGVGAVDQSILIKKPGKTLIFDLFPVKKASSIPKEVEDPVTCFKLLCQQRRAALSSLRLGESGTKDVSLTVPDTITTWETEAFCLSHQGFGLAPRKELTVFQPFFLELSLPYSIIRGEHFELKATTFNYLSSCIMVTVTPAPSLDYTLTPLSGDQYTSCLCGSERKTLSWTMAPSALGVVNVSVTAEDVGSHASCDNEIVSVPDRGRIDVVTTNTTNLKIPSRHVLRCDDVMRKVIPFGGSSSRNPGFGFKLTSGTQV